MLALPANVFRLAWAACSVRQKSEPAVNIAAVPVEWKKALTPDSWLAGGCKVEPSNFQRWRGKAAALRSVWGPLSHTAQHGGESHHIWCMLHSFSKADIQSCCMYVDSACTMRAVVSAADLPQPQDSFRGAFPAPLPSWAPSAGSAGSQLGTDAGMSSVLLTMVGSQCVSVTEIPQQLCSNICVSL